MKKKTSVWASSIYFNLLILLITFYSGIVGTDILQSVSTTNINLAPIVESKWTLNLCNCNQFKIKLGKLIHVIVVDENGKPVEGVGINYEVIAFLDDKEFFIDDIGVITNRAGRFSYHLPVGIYKISIGNPGECDFIDMPQIIEVNKNSCSSVKLIVKRKRYNEELNNNKNFNFRSPGRRKRG